MAIRQLTRRRLVLAAAAAGAASWLPARAASGAADRGPALDRDLVFEFVRAAHGDAERTRQLLARQPALVNACWDWGGGDWETALGGASHMGNAEIARFLLSRGARMDVFCAAMLGEIDLVRAFLAADPRVVHLAGPHGISLLRHAEQGGRQAVADLLRAHGA